MKWALMMIYLSLPQGDVVIQKTIPLDVCQQIRGMVNSQLLTQKLQAGGVVCKLLPENTLYI